MNDTTTSAPEFVWRRTTEGLSIGGHELPGTVWFLILGAILSVGVVYVIWMYVRDGHSIGWFWGTFLALLRLSVYAIISVVFLLPAWQNWEETRQQSRVVLGFDVSGSMNKRDDPVVEGIPPESRPTRQDKILATIGEPANPEGFLKRLQKTNPIAVYRWGAGLDEDYLMVQDGQVWERKDWEAPRESEGGKRPAGPELTRERFTAFLKPDFKFDIPEEGTEEVKKAARERKEKLERMVKNTNVGESALAVLSREINNMPQGVVLFSDFRSTEGGPQAFRDLAERARRAQVPVFVVVVGEDRPETRIEVVDTRGPDKARPEDPFPVAVDVTGQGLPERDITVFLDIFKPGQDPKKDTPFKTLDKKVTFKGGQLPRAQVEFPITPADFGDIPTDEPEDKQPGKPGEKPAEKPAKPIEKSDKPEFKVGEWHFVPRVPRDPAELNNEKFHTREPVMVRVEKRPMRVLLLASAPLRDYQFVRTMMVRESDKRRLELSIYLQPLPGQAVRRAGIVQDVPPERLLTRFPDKMEEGNTEDRFYNLANYDVIVAFDPNWEELTKQQTELIDRWVSQQGGGLVIVAGPIHTLELARAAARLKGAGGDRDKLKRILDDNPDLAKLKPILDLYPVVLKDVRLQQERNTAIPARLSFVNASPDMEFLKLDEDRPGLLDAWNEFFFGAGKPKDGAPPPVVRGFYDYYPVEKSKDNAVTVATFKDDTSPDKAEPPYLVIMPNYGAGRLVWLGSGQTWRLRQFREVWHERFWTKLVRYASAGSTGKSTRRIIPLVGTQFRTGVYAEFEAQLFGKDLLPLRQDASPKPKVVLRPPVGVTDIKAEHEIEMAPKPTGGGDWEGRFVARHLFKTPGEYGLEIRLGDSNDVVTQKIKVVETNAEEENTRPDLAAAYELASEADSVLDRIQDPAKKAQLRAALQRYRAEKPSDAKATTAADPSKEKLRLVFDLRSASMIPDCMKTVVNKQESRGKVDDLWDDGWVISEGSGGDKPMKFSYVLAAVVGLLCIEWLTRKLLRLA